MGKQVEILLGYATREKVDREGRRQSFDYFMDGVLKTPEGTGNGRGKTVELQVEESLW